MGGDGGVIPKNRRYLRGAGAGDKTGDAVQETNAADPSVLKEEQALAMKLCTISQQPLLLSQSKQDNNTQQQQDQVVICPYGRLYNREAIVQALLQQRQGKTNDARIEHIRGLKDLHSVRFHWGRSSSFSLKTGHDEESSLVATCPVRGTELNGMVPAVVLVPGSPGIPNVVSVRAIQELGQKAVDQEYGPATHSIRLLPHGDELEAIRTQHQALVRSQKKRKKKRKDATDEPALKSSKTETLGSSSSSSGPTKRANHVLDSIFTQPAVKLSEQEKADNLFARGSG